MEFLIYNTPGPHGLTPRDIDRRWSVALPLAKELAPFEVLEFEPISDYAKELFKSYRELRAVVTKRYAEQSLQRAKLANRFRRSKVVEPGMKVVYRHPRANSAGGRTAWKRAMSEPATVISVNGNRVKLRNGEAAGGKEIEVHLEDVIILQDDACDPERELSLEDEGVDDTERRNRSPGEMLEQKGNKQQDQRLKKPGAGKLTKLTIGQFIAYAGVGHANKMLRIGKVVAITRAEGIVGVHRFRPISDGRLRIRWEPLMLKDAYNAENPVLENIHARQIVTVVQLHDGIVSHAAARRLDRAGWKLDESDLVEEAALEESIPVGSLQRLGELFEGLRGAGSFSIEDDPSRGALVLADKPVMKVSFESKELLQRWVSEESRQVDFVEVFCGFQELLLRVREAGLKAADGFDSKVMSYGQTWCLDDKENQRLCAWLLVDVLEPLAVHLGIPCTHMSNIGLKDHAENQVSQGLLEFSAIVAEHQQALGFLASAENPVGSSLQDQPEWTKVVGVRGELKEPWRIVRLDACQAHLVYPGVDDDMGKPMQKGQVWISNFDLSAMALRCRRPNSLVGCSHEHRQVRGTMKLPSGRWVSVAKFSGKYTAEQGTLYARSLADALKSIQRPGNELLGKRTRLRELAESRSESKPVKKVPSGKMVCAEHSILAGKAVTWEGTEAEAILKAPEENEADRKVRVEKLRQEAKEAKIVWAQRAAAGEWDHVKADLVVYQYSGQEVKEDPRRQEEYRQQVVTGCGFGKGSEKPGLTEADVEATREVLHRKAAAFWLEGSPRTTVRFVQHDTIPTGPPVMSPPHNLKGEAAQWVDEALEKEVQRGQLERGSSPWGSPPFPTKEFPEHKRQRKRRLVVDYRRVNARTLRSVYFLRRASDVLGEVAGSAFMSLLDAVTGFNLVVNTERARKMLSIIARCGQFLPRCLTFGPHNGPEDFGFVGDRIFSGNRYFCKNWHAYVDDLTVRSGRVVDGVCLTDREAELRVKEAVKVGNSSNLNQQHQSPTEAFTNLGFDAAYLGGESTKVGGRKRKPAAEMVPRGEPVNSQQQKFLGPAYSCDPSPFAHPKEVDAGQKFLGPAYACDPSPYAHPKEYTKEDRGRDRKKGEGKKHLEGQIDGIKDPEGWRKEMKARDVRPQKYWDNRERLKWMGHALTRVLRHGECKPPFDKGGWLSIDDILLTPSLREWKAKEQDLDHLLTFEKKVRYEKSGRKMRAIQGHSERVGVVDEELYRKFDEDHPSWRPYLYHGTDVRNFDSILNHGLVAGKDQEGRAVENVGGVKSRNHVMMGLTDAVGEVQGVRSNTTGLVTIDAKRLKEMLTSEGLGLWCSKVGAVMCRIVPTAAISKMVNRKTGEVFFEEPDWDSSTEVESTDEEKRVWRKASISAGPASTPTGPAEPMEDEPCDEGDFSSGEEPETSGITTPMFGQGSSSSKATAEELEAGVKGTAAEEVVEERKSWIDPRPKAVRRLVPTSKAVPKGGKGAEVSAKAGVPKQKSMPKVLIKRKVRSRGSSEVSGRSGSKKRSISRKRSISASPLMEARAESRGRKVVLKPAPERERRSSSRTPARSRSRTPIRRKAEYADRSRLQRIESELAILRQEAAARLALYLDREELADVLERESEVDVARFGKLKADEWSRIKNRKRKEKEESVQKELESSGGWSCERCGAENLAWRTKCYTCSGKPPQDYEAPAGEERHYEKRHRGGRKHRKAKKVKQCRGLKQVKRAAIGLGPAYSSDPCPFAQAMIMPVEGALIGGGTLAAVAWALTSAVFKTADVAVESAVFVVQELALDVVVTAKRAGKSIEVWLQSLWYWCKRIVGVVGLFEFLRWLWWLDQQRDWARRALTSGLGLGRQFSSDPSPYAHPSLEWVTQDALAIECRSYHKIKELIGGVAESPEPDVWEVKSGNNKYKVVLNADLLRKGRQSSISCLIRSCGCMDHIQRGPICKHAGAVIAVLLARKKESAGEAVSRLEEVFSTPDAPQVPKISLEVEDPQTVIAAVGARGEEKDRRTVIAAVGARDEEQRTNPKSRALQRAAFAAGSAGSVQQGGGTVSALCFAGLREKAFRLAGLKEESSREAPAGYGRPEVKEKPEVPVEVKYAVPAEAAVKSVRIVGEAVQDQGGGVGEFDEVSMGAVLSVMDAVATQETAIREINKAKRLVHLNAYSFDRADVVSALVSARKRGLDVKVAMDKGMTLKGKTRDQLSMCKELIAAGICVHVAEGDNLTAVYRAVGRSVPGFLKGIMHQKSAMIDDLVIIGSCNWTTSSRGNFEIGVLFKVEPSHRDIVKEMLEVPFVSGQELTHAAVEEAQRARSESPTGRGFRRR